MRINASFPSRNHSEPFSATLLSKKVSRHHQLWIALSFAFGQLKEKLNANQNAKWQVKWHGFNCILPPAFGSLLNPFPQTPSSKTSAKFCCYKEALIFQPVKNDLQFLLTLFKINMPLRHIKLILVFRKKNRPTTKSIVLHSDQIFPKTCF